MQFTKSSAELYIPDGLSDGEALSRTTHICFAAHQDDIEIMALHGILECFGQKDSWFTGVVVTNGSGSPRDDLYADYTDEMMQVVRRKEQKKAAYVGEYTAQALLDYSSKEVKDAANEAVVRDIRALLEAARPRVVYTHNLTDKHDTHVAVTLRVISALRALPEELRPAQLLGCEVWRDLDWMVDADKVAMDVSQHENLAAALLGVFDSQICGGKRYDLATMGRRRAHATYHASHGTDSAEMLNFAMNLTPLLLDTALDPFAYAEAHIARFTGEVEARIRKMSGK